MAETQQSDVMTSDGKQQGLQASQGHQGHEREKNRLRRRNDQALLMSPFALLQRLADSVTGVFDDASRGPGQFGARAKGPAGVALWAPNVDVFQRGNELVIRADLPGLKPDDVTVEVSDDALTISGERRQEHQEERGGVYRFERNYGAFYRVIPLPEDANTDQAKARFDNGILEVVVPAPPDQASHGRRLEIAQGGETQGQKQAH